MADDGDDLVLSWKSAILYLHDFQTLAPGRWLTDNALCFWCEVLTHRVFEGLDGAVFVHPAAAFMALFEGTRGRQ